MVLLDMVLGLSVYWFFGDQSLAEIVSPSAPTTFLKATDVNLKKPKGLWNPSGMFREEFVVVLSLFFLDSFLFLFEA